MGNITFSILMTGTSDFFGLNFYTAYYGTEEQEGNVPSLGGDSGLITTQDSNWIPSASTWLKAGTILRAYVAIKIFLPPLISYHNFILLS
jgi:hypothetical protein